MGTRISGAHAVATMLLALAAGGVVAGCGSSGSESPTPAEVTLTVRPEGSPEERILGQIYTQALKAAGYRVRKTAKPSFGVSTNFEDVKHGLISGYPAHLSTALHYDLGVEVEEIPANSRAAYKRANAKFQEEGLIAFPPAPFTLANAIGMLRKTAEERDLKTDSDLQGQAEQMTIRAETYCHVSLDCLAGLERHYGTAFEAVSYERTLTEDLRFSNANPELRYKVLEDGEVDASMMFTTEGRLAARQKKFVILEDDRHVFPAGNAIWVTTPEIVEKAGPDYEKAIVEAQKGLTLPVMQELNARAELQHEPPAKVAAAYLKSMGYTG